MRGLKQEDIDAVFGECDFQDAVWCLTHQSRVRSLAVRCDDWRDFEDSVMRVIERLEQDPVVVHTFDEHRWPEFTVTGNGGKDGFIRIACSDCDWVKVFDAPVSFGGLTVATVRHGMGHQEEQR